MPLTDVELAKVEAANQPGTTPVVFIHGLWLLSSSWQPWRELLEAEGYATIAPSWPDDPATVEESLKDPGTFAGKTVMQVTDHYAEAIDVSAVVAASAGGGGMPGRSGGATCGMRLSHPPLPLHLPFPSRGGRGQDQRH